MDLFLKLVILLKIEIIPNEELLKKMKKSCFLFPSLFEGFGQVLLESFSCGLPVNDNI